MGNDSTRWLLLYLRYSWLGFSSLDLYFIDKQEGKTIIKVIKEVKKAKDEIQNS